MTAPTRQRRSERPVPAFAPSPGGDDLGHARRFVEDAVAGMRHLSVGDVEAVEAWLDGVENEARRLQARAIARTAAEARGDIGTDKIMDSIGSVGSLIAQYEQGLVDVEAQLEAGERIAPPEEPLMCIQPRSREERFEEARDTLANLLPKTDTGGHAEALQKLIAFVPFAPGEDAGAAVETMEIDLVLDDAADVAEGPSAEVLATRPAFDVEALLPALVDHAHRTARRHGKVLTASYAARDARLDPSLAEEWQEAAEAAIGELVALTLRTSEARKADGRTGAAHMALTVEGRGNAVELTITCPGRNVPRFAVDAPHSIEAGEDDGTVWVRFTARPEAERVA